MPALAGQINTEQYLFLAIEQRDIQVTYHITLHYIKKVK